MHPKRRIYILFSLVLAAICFLELKAQIKLPFLKAILVNHLDEEVRESSGLIYFANSFWTINDSGGKNMLYKIDPLTGRIGKELTVTNAQNIDWEELTADDQYIYIGDIGDNGHRRDEKQIYRLSKAAILKSKASRNIKSEIIRFSYPESDDFKKYDAEALISDGKLIHIFTKDLLESKHFTIPAKPGNYMATYIEKIASRGQVTGAAYHKKTKSIVLVGYFAFGDRLLWKLSDFTKNEFFNGKVEKFSLGDLSLTSQVEAVCFDQSSKVYFSNERFGKTNQSLWVLPDTFSK
jgi:hypothetical protein